MKAFKAYDIRDIYGRYFDSSTVRKIGFFLPKLNVDLVEIEAIASV